MDILFLHQNFPAQFVHLAPALRDRGHRVVALTAEGNTRNSPVETMRYRFQPRPVDPAACRLGRSYAEASDRATAVARAAQILRDRHGFMPEVVFGHIGWGETLFLHEIWPEARLLHYAEFYYAPHGRDAGFDPEFAPSSLESALAVRARQAHLAHAMAQSNAAVAPTHWQASSFPACFRKQITVLHDGIDTDAARPDPGARVVLPGGGPELRAGDEVLTFVSRNLEPYRGFHTFMRALPEVLAARPEAQVVIVGADGAGYGPGPLQGGSWKQVLLNEVADRLDMRRVHFTGWVPHAMFLALMQVSRVHAYLTVPFVLSWSMLEAMAAGALVVASLTPPVQEVITNGENGRLVDFFDVPGWSAALTDALAEPQKYQSERMAGRAHVLAHYDLHSHCLPRLVDFVENAGAV